jgi:hypothetical protein
MTASTDPTWAQLVATGSSLSDNSEYVTNSAMTATPGHRSVQQSHLACTGTYTGESSLQKYQGYKTRRQVVNIMAQWTSPAQKQLPSGRMTYRTPISSHKPW